MDETNIVNTSMTDIIDVVDDDSRSLYLFGECCDDWLPQAQAILRYNREDQAANIADNERKPIKIYIDSPGGDTRIERMFESLITTSHTPVYGINMANAYSAAALIFMACDRRYAMPFSQFLLHQGSVANVGGNYSEVIEFINTYQQDIADMTNYIFRYSNMPRDFIEEHIKHDWYISASMAVEYGVCDYVLQDLNEVL